MADTTKRNPKNAPGPWFVDVRCVSCDTCTDISPEIFGRDDTRRAYVKAHLPGEAYYFRQALESCPVEAVGDEADPSSLLTVS